MSTFPVLTSLSRPVGPSLNLHQSNKNPFVYKSGNWDVTSWKPIFCDETLTFSSSEIKFIVWAYSTEKVRFRLEYSSYNEEIKKQLQEVGLKTCYSVDSFTTDTTDELQKVYRVITEHYGIIDPDRVIERLAKWGSYHFPEFVLRSENWDLKDPTWIRPKTMVFVNHDLELVITGSEDGHVGFALLITNYNHKEKLKNRLVEAGIGVSYFAGFNAETTEELQKVYRMLCKYYPLTKHNELIERLAHYGDWKQEEANRSIPLEHIQQRV